MKFYREPVGVANLGKLRAFDSIPVDIWAIEWSPDRRWLGLVGWQTPVEIRETATLLHLKTIGKGKRIIHFAFSSDPAIVAYAENGTKVEKLNTMRGTSIEIATGVPQPAMEFSPDNQFLLASLTTGAKEIYRVDWSPTGDLLAAAGLESGIILWNGKDFSELKRLDAPEWVIGLKFSPDGKQLVAAGGNQSSRTDRKVTVYGIGHILTRMLE